jgi:hypothetical protein
VQENVLERLFELEPEEDPCEHGHPALADGWRELVSEVGLCDVCFEVVSIRLSDVAGRGLSAGISSSLW